MLDIKWIRENPEAFDNALKSRGLEKAAQLLTLRQGNGAAIRRIGYDRAARMIRALKGTK